jgi:hypothetical protein
MNLAKRFEPIVRAKFGSRYKKGRSKNGLEFKVCCPFCTRNGLKADRRYKLWINPTQGVYRCWRCNTRGQAVDLLGDIASLVENPFQPSAAPRLVQVETMPGQVVSLADTDLEHPGYKYMKLRGFDPHAMGTYYGLSYCYDGQVFGKGSFRFNTFNTIIFPLWMHGTVVGWQARLLYNPDDLDEAECQAMGYTLDEDGTYCRPPKYFTSPGLEKGKVLYNFDLAAQSQIVVITEGPTDVLAAGPCAVGTLGKGISDEQMRLIKNQWDVVIILLDPGDADTESYNLHQALIETVPNTVTVKLAGYSDPGSAPTSAIWKQIDVQARRKGIALESFNWGPHWCDQIMKRS